MSWPACRYFADLLGCGQDKGNVRIAAFTQRCRDANAYRIDIAQRAKVRGWGKPPRFHRISNGLIRDIPDVGLSVFQPGDLVLIEIDTHDFEAGRSDL